MATVLPPTTYLGRCHCGAVRFQVLAHIDHLRACDCSVCRRRGALVFRVAQEALRLLTPLEALTQYRWGSGTGCDYFCPTCGDLPFRRPSAPTRTEQEAGAIPFDGWAVNVFCLQGFDPTSVPVKRIHGSRLRYP